MPRLPGGPATDLPACPRPGHGAHRVVKDGRYGTPPRQRFRCIGPAGFHRFVPELPRHEAHNSVCGTCATHVPAPYSAVVVGTGAKYWQNPSVRSQLRDAEGFPLVGWSARAPS